jgi:hypothetical protein
MPDLIYQTTIHTVGGSVTFWLHGTYTTDDGDGWTADFVPTHWAVVDRRPGADQLAVEIDAGWAGTIRENQHSLNDPPGDPNAPGDKDWNKLSTPQRNTVIASDAGVIVAVVDVV